jgi:hypothetical protein
MSASVLSEPDGKKASVSSLDLNSLNEAGAALEAEVEAEVGTTLEQEQGGADDDLLAPGEDQGKVFFFFFFVFCFFFFFFFFFFFVSFLSFEFAFDVC